jgi:hypothetical protein
MDEKETFGSRKNRTPFPKLFEIYFCLKKGLSFVQGKIYDFGDRLPDIKWLLQTIYRYFLIQQLTQNSVTFRNRIFMKEIDFLQQKHL